MQTRKWINLVVVLWGLFLFGACEYANIQPEAPPPPPPPGDTTSFSLEVQPIFNDGCVLCHNGTEPPDLRAGNSYQSLLDNNFVVKFKPEESVLYNSVIPGGKMAGYSNSSHNATIYNWIKEGAKNN